MFRSRVVWKGGPEGTGEASIGGSAALAVANPMTSGEEGANPETLLAASVATCLSITLGYMAARYGYSEATVEVTATLGTVEGRNRVVALDAACTFAPAGVDPAKLEEAVKKAERGCVIGRSLAPAIPITYRVA